MTTAENLKFAAAADGTLLQYEVVGQGEPIIFLHGGGTSRSAFSRQRSTLAGDFQLILRDLRGRGGSVCTIPADYGLDTTEVTDVLTVMDAEGIQRAHLVGHSTGGAIAFCFALEHPERVDRLLLLEPSLATLLPPDVFDREVAATGRAVAAALPAGPQAVLAAMWDPLLGEGWQAKVRPAALARMEAMLDITLAEGHALANLAVTDESLRALSIPTLLLYAEQSFPWEALIAQRIRRVRPDIAQILIPDATHNMHQDQPDQVNAALRAFLAV